MRSMLTSFSKRTCSTSTPASSTHIQDKALSFSNTRQVYQSQSTTNLARAALVFRLCSSPRLVHNSAYLISRSYSIFGEKITNLVLKNTFFGHFCGGETALDIKGEAAKLNVYGIGSILDYAAEADVKAPRDLNVRF